MFKVKSVQETINLIRENFNQIHLDVIEIDSINSLRYVVAQDVISKENIPHFNRSTVDGYAVAHKTTSLASNSIPIVLSLKGEVLMGKESKFKLSEDETVYVPTGGHLPSGTDSVVMVENTEMLGDEIVIYKSTSKWGNVLIKGSDIAIGDKVIEKNALIEPRHIGVLTALGMDKIKVYEKIKCMIISTGDEIVDLKEIPKIGEIRDINSYTISNYLKKVGLEVTKVIILNDDFDMYKKAIIEGFIDNDIVITSGGSSVGTKDYTAKVLSELDGAQILVHGISIKPGKPTIIAKYYDKIFFGLPGQPTSAYIVLSTLIDEMVRTIYDMKKIVSPYVEAKLMINVPSSPGRRTYQLVNLDYDNEYIATPLFTKSGMISVLSRANGYIVIDEFSEGIDSNKLVKVYRLGD